ncbi:CinA family protein [Caldisericum sp.]|uniref:CinA family protein n=1 Tax=Caldisericum sp. TaxID=2499687 RepID=UPI003D10237D
MIEISQKLVKALKERNLTLSTAESITGGLVAKLITDIPGSSKVYLGGIVAYSPKAKIEILKIDREIVEMLGTVDPLVAELMSTNVRNLFKADIGLSTTGIAGPDPIEGKPVGLSYVGISVHNKNFVFENKFQGDRIIIRENVAEFLLKKLLEILEGG